MYRTLFDLAGYAIFAWLLLILLPGWRITRRVAESAIFPAYLALLYVVGLVAVLRESGPGFMAGFNSADGVLGLLVQEPIAILAWIHILAFDQIVALVIYRDNMRYRFVPLPLQSVIMVATLMLGPVGFLTYWLVRLSRARQPVAWGEGHADTAHAVAPTYRSVVGAARGVVAGMLSLWRRERVLFGIGAAGITLAVVTAVIAAINGGWLLGAEGRLLEAVKFDIAVGIFFLTLALIAPFAPVPVDARRRWLRWAVGLAAFAYWMENVQAWRGLNPRFSAIAGPIDQVLGGLFFLSALGVLVIFVDLLSRFWSDDALPDHPALRTSLRYATVAALGAFGIGVVISLTGSRFIGAGNMMLLHAAGFHGLQAIPLVALVAGVASANGVVARRAVHVAGGGWLLVCAGLLAQALSGRAPTEPGVALAATLAGAVLWLSSLPIAWRARQPSAAPVSTF